MGLLQSNFWQPSVDAQDTIKEIGKVTGNEQAANDAAQKIKGAPAAFSRAMSGVAGTASGLGGSPMSGAALSPDFTQSYGINSPSMSNPFIQAPVQVTPAADFSTTDPSITSNPFYQQQLANTTALSARANGTAPASSSVAAQQYAQAQQAQQAALFSQLASQRGPSNPLAVRSAMQQNAGNQAQLAQQAGVARLQEQQQAQTALGSALSSARGQDIQQGNDIFSQNSENARQNAQQGAQYQTLVSQYSQMGLNADEARARAAIDTQKNAIEVQKANNALKGGELQTAGQVAGMLPDILGAAGGIAGGMFGGPVGAIAGAKLGQTAGTDIGNANTNGSYGTSVNQDNIYQDPNNPSQNIDTSDTSVDSSGGAQRAYQKQAGIGS